MTAPGRSAPGRTFQTLGAEPAGAERGWRHCGHSHQLLSEDRRYVSAMTLAPLATIRCPACSHLSSAVMPTDACLYFYECPACRVVLKPEPGDCCVFCSYSPDPCPPKVSAKAKRPT